MHIRPADAPWSAARLCSQAYQYQAGMQHSRARQTPAAAQHTFTLHMLGMQQKRLHVGSRAFQAHQALLVRYDQAVGPC